MSSCTRTKDDPRRRRSRSGVEDVSADASVGGTITHRDMGASSDPSRCGCVSNGNDVLIPGSKTFKEQLNIDAKHRLRVEILGRGKVAVSEGSQYTVPGSSSFTPVALRRVTGSLEVMNPFAAAEHGINSSRVSFKEEQLARGSAMEIDNEN